MKVVKSSNTAVIEQRMHVFPYRVTICTAPERFEKFLANAATDDDGFNAK